MLVCVPGRDRVNRMAPSEPKRLSIIEHRQGTKQQQWKFADDGRLISVTAGLESKGPNKASVGLRQLLASAFLPVGYPGSVTADYRGYVVWNTVQAISSYVRGVLSAHAVFKGVGVGSQAATALGAVFQFFIRDILGMAGGIMFAFAAGGNFDSNAKQWRLFADVMNDLAMALDLASPLLPGSCFMALLCLASIARAMVGMASGATHAALTQHFAASGGNAADISAKADSRERAATIIGSLLGMAFTRHLADNFLAAWAFFAVLTVLHVWANIQAMRCLVLSSLNETRLKLLLQHYQEKDKVLTPQQVSQLENLAVPPLAVVVEALLGRRCSRVVFGAQLSDALGRAAAQQGTTIGQALQQVLGQQQSAANRQYILFITGRKQQVVEVVLHSGAVQQTCLQAYIQAQHLAGHLHKASTDYSSTTRELLDRNQKWVDKQLPIFLKALRQYGWETNKMYLQRPQWVAEW